MITYPEVLLHIDGNWTAAQSGETIGVMNPATGDENGRVAHADIPDLDRAVAAAERGFALWRKMSAFDRSKILRNAAALLRERADLIAPIVTMEQGKPLGEARMETLGSADVIDWFAEEARRTYGRVIPARAEGVYQLSLREPVGPVAAFSPWNFPINQANRKIAIALAAGCSIIVKGPEETPASCMELVRCYVDAGLPPGVVQLVFGAPARISNHLIPHPGIRKISFTGSTPVGKHLAALAGQHMKRLTMELGGHAPAIVFDDADVGAATKILAAAKFRNAGQVCIAPTRFLVQHGAYEEFVERFTAAARALKVGSGLEEGTQMGPLANPRRVAAMEELVGDAVQHGAELRTGGKRIGNVGNFFEPTVLSGVTREMRAMNEEPFGPLALIAPFKDIDHAMEEANRLPFGLASYAFTRSAKTATAVAARVEAGMMTINHMGLSLPEVPIGGIKESGYGSEGGAEAMEAYLNIKFVTQAGVE